MAVEDMEKTTFITPWGTYYYIIVLFGLEKHRGYLSKDNYYLAAGPNAQGG